MSAISLLFVACILVKAIAGPCALPGAGLTTLPGPGTSNSLSTCCWYKSSTCCSNPSLATRVVPSATRQNQNAIDAVGITSDCIYAIADLSCMLCSGNLSFVARTPRSTTSSDWTATLCPSFCESAWNVCRNEHLAALFPGESRMPTDSTTFCHMLFDVVEASVFPASVTKMHSDVRNTGVGSCFAGTSIQKVKCANCIANTPYSRCDGATTGGYTDTPRINPVSAPPAAEDTLLVSIGVALIGVLVILILVAIIVYARKRTVPARRGRDYFPSSEEALSDTSGGLSQSS